MSNNRTLKEWWKFDGKLRSLKAYAREEAQGSWSERGEAARDWLANKRGSKRK